MDNIFVKNPITLHILSVNLASDTPFTTQEEITFIGGAPRTPSKSSKRGAADSDVDIFDISEILEDTPSTPVTGKPAKPTKPAKPVTEKPTTSTSSVTRRETQASIYPEDRVSEFKAKVYTETGIEPYKQYLFVKFNDNYVPLSYRVLSNGMINTDIRKSLESPSRVLGLPLDMDLYNDRDAITVEANDMFFTMQDVHQIFRTQDLYIISLDDVVGPLRGNLDELLRTDRDQVELIYYGYVIKYWPMLTFGIFKKYISSDKSIKENYPDLSPNITKLREMQASEKAVLDAKYETFFKVGAEYSPQVALFEKPSPRSVIDTAIKSATMIVHEKSWDSSRVGYEFSGKTRIDMRSLFYHLHASKEAPIIRVRLIMSGQIVTITKIRTPGATSSASSASADDDIRKVYDNLRLRLHMSYFNSIMVALRTSGTRAKFFILIIRDTGKYEIKSIWNEDDKMNFKDLVSAISETVNPYIKKINEMGRTVFQGGLQLEPVSESNASFSDLNMALFWKKNINSATFDTLKRMLTDILPSKIIRFAESPSTMNEMISYLLVKGMTEEDLSGVYKHLQVSNYYEYMSDAKVKQKWFQIFELGRAITITHRTIDVKIEVENLKEKEFKYFYQHIVSLIYEVKQARASAPGKSALGKPVKYKPGANLLKILKGRDPELYNFKKFGSDVVYSRKCQKDHQPVPYSPEEYESLSALDRKKATKFWNFTSQTPMYYVCPNPKYPHMSFIVGQHPKGYCLPCCKKTPMFSYDMTVGRATKKSNIYEVCLGNHVYTEEDSDMGPSRYIMNYGKVIDTGRIGKLPDILDRWIIYNAEEKDIMARSRPDSIVYYNDNEYSVDKLWKITKNNKTRIVPVSSLVDQLRQKSWSATKTVKHSDAEYSPADVAKKPALSPDHYSRMINVDTSYPILVYRNITEGWQVVIDGLHRLSKMAYIDKEEFAQIKYITHKQLEKAKIPKGVERKNVGKKLLVQKALKKPNYYLYGIMQNSQYVDNIGAAYSIAMALGKTLPEYVTEIIETLAKTDVYGSLLQGRIDRYFRDKRDLMHALTSLFVGKGSTGVDLGSVGKFQKWNDLFVDLTRLCLGVYVVVLEDHSGSIVLNLPIKINTVQDIFPARVEHNNQSDTYFEYVYLFKRQKRSRTLYTVGDIYYPIFVITPQEFFKNMQIDRRVYNQNDEIVNLTRKLLTNALVPGVPGSPSAPSAPDVSDAGTERDITLYTVMEYLTKPAKPAKPAKRIRTLYVNGKGLCYALEFSDGIIMPIKYSITDVIPEKYFVGEKKVISHEPIKAWKSDMRAVKVFMTDFNAFIAQTSAYLPIKVDKVLCDLTGSVLGFVSNGLRYYIAGKPKKSDFLKYMRARDSDNVSDIPAIKLNYDPAKINALIHNAQHSARTDVNPIMKDMQRIIYEKHLYELFTSELMAHLDKERNKEIRRKLIQILSYENLRGKSESVQKQIREILLPTYPEDNERVQEILGNYYASHYNKKALLQEFESLVYQFDRMSLNALRDMSEGFFRNDLATRKSTLTKINAFIMNIANAFVIRRAPKFSSPGAPGALVECGSGLGARAPYCDRGKLVLSEDKLRKNVQIFSEEIVNPLHREYILSSIYISEAFNAYKFPKQPGEELYVKFG
jgi:hypothetical protein